MSRASKNRRRRRGETLVEVLVAALIVGVCIASLVSLWSFSFMTTRDSDDQDIAYTLARNAIETVKQTGFYFTPEAPASAPVLHYYDSNQTNLDSKPTTARFKVATTVVSAKLALGANPVKPTDDALRTVSVTVSLVQGGQIVTQASTYLVRAGI